MFSYIPYIVMVISLIGTIANSFQKRWCFYVWSFTNVFWIYHNFINLQYAQCGLYIINLVTCIIGLVKWKKKRRKKLMNTKVIIKGFLSETPKRSASPNGDMYIRLTVASIREEGETKTVDFFDVKAEYKSDLFFSLEKGMGVVILGHLTAERYTYKNNIYNNIRIFAEEIKELPFDEKETELPEEYINCIMAMGGVADEIYNC